MKFLNKTVYPIKSYFLSVFYLAFPHHCHICDKKIIDENQICPECLIKIPPFELIEISRPEIIQSNFKKIYSGWNYSPLFQSLIEKIKFKKKLKLLKTILNQCQFNISDQIDLISFVPLSFQGYIERGFNQSKVIANKLSKELNIPVISLFHKKSRTKQSWKDRQERLEMISDSPFTIRKATGLKDKKILLIDDIITTGSTLASLAVLLRKQGAQVYALTLIHVDKENFSSHIESQS